MKAVRVSMSGLDLQLAADPQPAQATDQVVKAKAVGKGLFGQWGQVAQADQAGVQGVNIIRIDTNGGTNAFESAWIGHFRGCRCPVPDGDLGRYGAIGAIGPHGIVGQRFGGSLCQTFSPSIRIQGFRRDGFVDGKGVDALYAFTGLGAGHRAAGKKHRRDAECGPGMRRTTPPLPGDGR